MTGADIGGLDLACTIANGGPSAISGPAVDEGDWIWIQLWLRLGFGERVQLESGEGVELLC
jgi:hypothetical protein